MKRVISIICAAVLIVSSIGLVACSGGSQDISGTYQLTDMVSDGQDMSSMLSVVTVTMTIEGESASLEMNGETLTWKVDTSAKTITNETGASIPYRVEDDLLILEGEGSTSGDKMVFKKQ